MDLSPSKVPRTGGRVRTAPAQLAVAALAAGTLSGIPSTLWAAATGANVLAATRAAGTLFPGRRHQPGVLAGAAVHAVLSLLWVAALDGASRRRPLGPAGGAVAGLAIAGLDLAVIGRYYPAIEALPAVPQWVDHAAFGAVAAAALRGCGRAGAVR